MKQGAAHPDGAPSPPFLRQASLTAPPDASLPQDSEPLVPSRAGTARNVETSRSTARSATSELYRISSMRAGVMAIAVRTEENG